MAVCCRQQPELEDQEKQFHRPSRLQRRREEHIAEDPDNLITASSGHAYINGCDVAYDLKNAFMGVGTVVETSEFYFYLALNETFRYVGEIYGMTGEFIQNEVVETLAKVKMSEWADERLGTFSKGMRQRIAFGLALMGSPNVIVLDEPTSGLDPGRTAEMRGILKNLRNTNHNLTILMSLHMMHEVSDPCDRVALINYGKLLMNDIIDKFVEGSGVRTVIVKTIKEPDEKVVFIILRLSNVTSVVCSGNETSVKVTGDKPEEVKFIG